jgi:hypothetical protein
VQKELAKGGDFAVLAKKYSTDAVTKEKGGDLGPVSQSGFFGLARPAPALARERVRGADQLRAGPIKTSLGYHLLRGHRPHAGDDASARGGQAADRAAADRSRPTRTSTSRASPPRASSLGVKTDDARDRRADQRQEVRASRCSATPARCPTWTSG